ncbi:MAG: response regulator [Candidatus Hydrothermarchaeales archaeon]
MGDVELLVVDDDPRMVEGLTEILEAEGYKVEAFEDPNAALSEAKKRSFPIALVDLIMPGRTGLEFLRELGKARSDTKVIIITGFGSIESAVEVMKAGAADYISKPFKINEIQNVIKRTLEGIRFEQNLPRSLEASGTGRIIKAISNPIRRGVLILLTSKKKMRFTDIKNALDVDDPTKLSFHLRELRGSGLLRQDQSKLYMLTTSGGKIARLILELEKDPY